MAVSSQPIASDDHPGYRYSSYYSAWECFSFHKGSLLSYPPQGSSYCQYNAVFWEKKEPFQISAFCLGTNVFFVKKHFLNKKPLANYVKTFYNEIV